ncbi:DUF2742 domain-containing protein [Mycolicibacterium sp. P9-64]|nr:DUF2742 domain-containing protein [Mycolicibacterium sp. P9-64]
MTSTASRQVSWWDVHEFVAPMLVAVGPIPPAGTPEWCLLPAGDARKVIALLDAAQHWVLRVETAQAAFAEVSRNIAGAADWSAVGQQKLQRDWAIRSGARISRVKS